MNVDEYLRLGEQYEGMGYATDGCSIIGWIVHWLWPQLERACWSHDFARQGIIETKNQAENDNLFKDALKHLGAPRPLRFIMYTFTRAQGWAKDKFGFGLGAFITAILFLMFFIVGIANSNPEIGRQIHYVMDQNNANNEAKFSADQCQAGVYPDGNGSAQGYALCVKFQPNEPFPENTNTKELSFDTTGFECELFDYSNNAGADVGYNVTQYNSQNWTAKYHKQQVTGGWRVKYYQYCQDGAQQ